MAVPSPVSFNALNQVTFGIAAGDFTMAATSYVGLVTFGFIYKTDWSPWYTNPVTIWTPFY